MRHTERNDSIMSFRAIFVIPCHDTITVSDTTFTYAGTSFTENVANNGSVSGTTTITISNNDPTGPVEFIDDVASKMSYSNLPTGLSVNIKRLSDFKLELTLTGRATNHNNVDDVANFGIMFSLGATKLHSVEAIKMDKTDLTIDFSDNFAIDTYTLTYTAGANGSLTGTTPQTINHGSNGTAITAVPNANYHFVDWTDGSTTNPRTDTGITADITQEATFEDIPKVINVTSTTTDGTYGIGYGVAVTVEFNKNVTVTGTPQLEMETNNTPDTKADYVSGSGGATLIFTYTVVDNDATADLDYTGTSALTLNGGTIQDSIGVDAVLTLAAPAATNSLGANKAIIIDGIAPIPGNSGTLVKLDYSKEQVQINWTKGTDNVSAVSNLTYTLYNSLNNNITTLADVKNNGTVNVAATTDVDKLIAISLAQTTNYYFNVLITDEAGNEAVYSSALMYTGGCTDCSLDIAGCPFGSNYSTVSINPEISIDPTLMGDNLFYTSEQAAVSITGTSNAESGQSISLIISDGSTNINDTVTATGGSWSSDVDLSTLNNTTLSISANVADIAGNTATVATHNSLVKSALSAPVIANGTAQTITRGANVNPTITFAGSGGTPTNCSMTPALANVTVAINGIGCQITGTVNASVALGTNTYTITATNGAGNDTGNVDITVNSSALPATPSAPVLANNVSNQIFVSYSSISGATYYRLYHATSKNGSYSQLYGGANLIYNHTGLTKDSAHYYKLKACTDSNISKCSNHSPISSAYSIDIRKQPLLIIAIEWNDKTLTDSLSSWSSKIFGTSEGQLNHYYNEISYGRFKFIKTNETYDVNDGIIKVVLNKNHPNPGSDSSKDTAFLDDIKTAVSQADPFLDFSQFDADSSTGISASELQIMFIVAGGESAMGQSPGVWAHAWNFSGNGPQHDGVYLMDNIDGGKYSRFGEMHSASRTANIGVIAHELGHATFALPDLYDYDGSSFGAGFFGLMGYGTWGIKDGDSHPGDTPVHMTGWSKTKSGFISPIDITANTTLDLKSTDQRGPDGYKLYKFKSSDPKEYFLIENRSNFGYDRGFKGKLDGSYVGGALILHIDENKTDNKDDNQRLVDVEEADNLVLGPPAKISDGHANNLWFSGNKDSFSRLSTPNSNWNGGSESGISISNISAPGASMSIDVGF